MPVKFDTKNHPFCTSSEKLFLKDGNFDNHWVGHSVIKFVDAEFFQIRNETKERGERKMMTFLCRSYNRVLWRRHKSLKEDYRWKNHGNNI